jgi:hypothetical protein
MFSNKERRILVVLDYSEGDVIKLELFKINELDNSSVSSGAELPF